MKFTNQRTLAAALLIGMGMGNALAQKPEILEYKPLETAIKAGLKPITNSKKVPVIAWGADVATRLAAMDGTLPGTELYREDNFPVQVSNCLGGSSPYLRGTCR